MKSALLFLASGLLGSFLVIACAESTSDIPPGSSEGSPKEDAPSATLPAPSQGTKEPSANTSSSSSSTSSTSSSSSSGESSSGASVPACTWSGDIQKLIEKASEIKAGAPCDATCNPTTHCCFNLLGGLGGGGGGGGIPGFEDAGMPGGGGAGGTCVSN